MAYLQITYSLGFEFRFFSPPSSRACAGVWLWMEAGNAGVSSSLAGAAVDGSRPSHSRPGGVIALELRQRRKKGDFQVLVFSPLTTTFSTKIKQNMHVVTPWNWRWIQSAKKNHPLFLLTNINGICLKRAESWRLIEGSSDEGSSFCYERDAAWEMHIWSLFTKMGVILLKDFLLAK